jgi:hypothetical protein
MQQIVRKYSNIPACSKYSVSIQIFLHVANIPGVSKHSENILNILACGKDSGKIHIYQHLANIRGISKYSSMHKISRKYTNIPAYGKYSGNIKLSSMR